MLERFRTNKNEISDNLPDIDKVEGICPVFMTIPPEGVKRIIHMKNCNHDYCKYTASFVTAMISSFISVNQKEPSEKEKADYELSLEKEVYEIFRKSGFDYKTINKILEQVDYLFYVQEGRE